MNDTSPVKWSKVPEVTLGFWIIKIIATTLGETGGDALSMTLNLGYAVSSVIFIALVDEATPTVLICPKDSVYDKNISTLQEIKARNGSVIAVATEGDTAIAKMADDVLYIPEAPEVLQPILASIPLQLFAYHTAVLLGRDVDKPRNLAKSVTVE